MLSRQKRILYAITMTALIVNPIAVWSETIAIPVFLDYQQLQAHLMRDQFKAPDNTARYLLDADGCASITFSEPHLSAEGEFLRVDAMILATIGVPATGGCTVITRWTGRTDIRSKPALVSGQPLSVKFRVQDARLYDQQDRLLTDSLVLQPVKEQLHLLLNRYTLDLKPETNQLKVLLPYFLPRYSADRLTRMIDSLRIGHLVVRPKGLDIGLTILDISADGLRRLARLLNDDPYIDPLHYLNDIDPVLQQLFGFGMPGEIIQPKKSHRFNFQQIRPAYAANARDRLNRWIPTAAELNAYLLEIRNLLLEEADDRIRSSSIAEECTRIFRKLMLTTAWQESCWRQYIMQNRKVVPLVSGSGDIGMLQINEKVWRGFYSPAKLSWDITYNARAGSEILSKFMVNYALKQPEHKHGGDPSNLARATYSAYNGGPSQVSRYRKSDVPAAHKKIDIAFWEKYQQVYQGQELAVAQCLGGQPTSPVTTALQINQSLKQSAPEHVTADGSARRIENVEWIRSRKPDHFTLQLAAMTSEQAVKDFLKQHPQPGSFANRADAQKAAVRFAPLKPWIRDFGSIQQTVKN